MSKEFVVSSNRHETSVAILEDDQLVEIYFQRQQEYSLAGSIHKGRVTRVLPGMQSAFVDIGLERDAFLYVSDFFEDNDEYEQVVGSRGGEGAAPGKGRRPGASRSRAGKIDEPRARIEPEAGDPGRAAPERSCRRSSGRRKRPRSDGRSPDRSGQPDRGGADRDGRDRRGGRRPPAAPGTRQGIPGFEVRSRPCARRGNQTRRGRAAEDVAAEHDEPTEELPVLPGESISKYREIDPESQAGVGPESTEGRRGRRRLRAEEEAAEVR